MVKFFKALLISIPIMLTHIILFYAFIWVKAFEVWPLVWAIVLVFFLFELSIAGLVLEASYEGRRKT
uniref:Uncharacterized protein n=2 Tax=unclassified Caudoviricetes TaxID=2788787 RepID=A0A8S5LTL6_9CAUD|nr:MAG TPA: hypothetical protein [Siphoviridae sp. ctKm44]DAE09906.1 MAG TPA: hypothetical protein [Siphoviridae sp. ctJdE31]